MIRKCIMFSRLPEIGVDEPFSGPPPAARSSEGLFGQLQLSSDIRPLGSGHGSRGPLAQQWDLVLVSLSEHWDLSIKRFVLDPLGMVLQTHPDKHLQFGGKFPLPLSVALVRHGRSLEEHAEHVTTQFPAAVLFGREHDLVWGDPVVGYSPVTTQHPDNHIRYTVLRLKGRGVLDNLQ